MCWRLQWMSVLIGALPHLRSHSHFLWLCLPFTMSSWFRAEKSRWTRVCKSRWLLRIWLRSRSHDRLMHLELPSLWPWLYSQQRLDVMHPLAHLAHALHLLVRSSDLDWNDSHEPKPSTLFSRGDNFPAFNRLHCPLTDYLWSSLVPLLPYGISKGCRLPYYWLVCSVHLEFGHPYRRVEIDRWPSFQTLARS